jgi:hypothetical protein
VALRDDEKTSIAVLYGLSLWLLCACGGAPSVAQTTNAATPHLGKFARFERWAQRVASSDVRLRGAEALREATLAPLRSDPDVLWAEVQTDGKTRWELAVPIKPELLSFARIEAAELGTLKVALPDGCPIKGGKVACVVVQRERDEAHPYGVKIAYRVAESLVVRR